MPGSGTGSRNQTTQTQQSQSQTQNPWEPTIEPLKALIGQLGGQVGSTALTGNETNALDQLQANAQGSGQYTKPLQDIAAGVMGQDRSGYATGAYDAYKQQVDPYLQSDYLDPYKNPAFQNYLQTTTNDIQNRVNGMFAGSGRDMSGANLQTLARGITEGTAPIFANQYNQNVATQRGAQDNLYSAGNTTAGVLSGMDQSRLQTAQGAADAALAAQNYAPNSILGAASQARSLPLSNIGNVASLLTPLAGLGGTSQGTSSGTANSQMTYKQPLAQTVGNWATAGVNGMQALSGIPSGLNGIGRGVGILGNWFSPY